MTYGENDILERLRETGVKLVRLAFCDLFGTPKSVSVTSDQLPRILRGGISFDAAAIPGFYDRTGRSDLFLRPDPDTFAILPWLQPYDCVARLFCDVVMPDGSPFDRDARSLLRRTLQRAETLGFSFSVGPECEFYLFKNGAYGSPTFEPQDNGGYFDVFPLDRCECVRREVSSALEQLGIEPEASHHEQGPGQNEIDFRHKGALAAADDLITFKSAVKAIAFNNGLHASFLPKPLPEKSGSGLHINLSVRQGDRDLFSGFGADGIDPLAGSFVAGILARAAEITAFLDPLPSSYQRLGRLEAPGYIGWSSQNRSQLIRIPSGSAGESGVDPRDRIELRSPDPSANPYLAFTLIIEAGLDGLERGLPLPEPVDCDLFGAPDALLRRMRRLPDTLSRALFAAQNSGFVRRVLGSKLLDCYITEKQRELHELEIARDREKLIYDRYFCVV